MDDAVRRAYRKSRHIDKVVEKIRKMLKPEIIYLYNQRVGTTGHTSGFKLCIVVDCADKEQVERRIYLEVDCEVPFDVLIYTPEEWRQLSTFHDSFAGKIARTGMVLYG